MKEPIFVHFEAFQQRGILPSINIEDLSRSCDNS